MNIIRKFLLVTSTLALLPLLATTATAADQVLSGDDLVQALSGKSFSCVADGKPMKLSFSKATSKGHTDFKAEWNGKKFKGNYRLSRKGQYSSKGRKRTISRSGNGSITIAGPGLPTATCK